MSWCRVCFAGWEDMAADAEALCRACAVDAVVAGEHEVECRCGPCAVLRALEAIPHAPPWQSLPEVRGVLEGEEAEARAGDPRTPTTLAVWLRAHRVVRPRRPGEVIPGFWSDMAALDREAEE